MKLVLSFSTLNFTFEKLFEMLKFGVKHKLSSAVHILFMKSTPRRTGKNDILMMLRNTKKTCSFEVEILNFEILPCNVYFYK